MVLNGSSGPASTRRRYRPVSRSEFSYETFSRRPRRLFRSRPRRSPALRSVSPTSRAVSELRSLLPPLPSSRLWRPYGVRMKLIVFARRRIVLRVHGVANNGGETSTDRRAKPPYRTHVRTQTRRRVCAFRIRVKLRRVSRRGVCTRWWGAVVRVMTCADILLPSRQ